MKYFLLLFVLLIQACSFKQASSIKSATVIFKTPIIKFYDKGFIYKYDDYINLQVYNLGNIALNLNIYKNRICKSTLECLDAKDFNEKYLSSDYKSSFLYDLFSKNKINFKDKLNKIFIKVKYD